MRAALFIINEPSGANLSQLGAPRLGLALRCIPGLNYLALQTVCLNVIKISMYVACLPSNCVAVI